MARFYNPYPTISGLDHICFGSFYSSTTQQAPVANVPQAVVFENTYFANGISVQNDANGNKTKFVFSHRGVYNFDFSGQLYHAGGGEDNIHMWFRQNGIDVPDSNTRMTLSNQTPYQVASWNFFFDIEPNDYVQLVGYPEDIAISLITLPANSHPAVPSVIATINQVA